MAQIKMDVTEYEAMKENKKLLENSLQRERELKKEVDRLNQEKIDALKKAQKKVVKINRKEVTEYALIQKNPHEIIENMRALLTRGGSYNGEYMGSSVESIINTFFDKTKAVSMPEEEVTAHGLDDIKSEIRKELEEKIDKETQEKLENAEHALKEKEELLKEIDKLRGDNKTLSEARSELISKVNNLSDKLEKCQDTDHTIYRQSQYFNGIKLLLKNGYTRWNKKKLLDEIIELIKMEWINENRS